VYIPGYTVTRFSEILRRYDIVPAPQRSQTTGWREFIRWHMDVLGEPISPPLRC